MKKMPTLFKREFINSHVVSISDEVTEGCEWVLNGEGKATRKHDGTCCLIQDGKIFKRFDYKQGRTLPAGAIPCQEKADEITGHFPHWVLCVEGNPSDKYFIDTFKRYPPLENGTYELCGVHINGNKEKVNVNENHFGNEILIKHGSVELIGLERTFNGIKLWLTDNKIEGIVFHRGNGEMCKIKRSDFGLEW